MKIGRGRGLEEPRFFARRIEVKAAGSGLSRVDIISALSRHILREI